jgi:hypothetical protein
VVLKNHSIIRNYPLSSLKQLEKRFAVFIVALQAIHPNRSNLVVIFINTKKHNHFEAPFAGPDCAFNVQFSITAH